MAVEIVVEGGEAVAGLVAELYEGLSVAPPELDDGEEFDELAGVVAAREDGALLGWAQLYPRAEGDVLVQWILVPRERERIERGDAVTRAGTEREARVLAELFRGAAGRVRAPGALVWSDTEADLDARTAAELGAFVEEELGRHWAVRMSEWRPPAGLPPVTVREPGPGLLDVELADERGGARARLSAIVTGPEAFAEKVVHDGVTAEELTGLVSAFVAALRERPGVEAVEVRELDDPVLGRALAAAGLSVSSRWNRYRLPVG